MQWLLLVVLVLIVVAGVFITVHVIEQRKTPTATPTGTPTPSSTPTAASTPTVTATPMPSSTPTGTPTASSTPTAASTPTVTATPIPSSTATATYIPTPTSSQPVRLLVHPYVGAASHGEVVISWVTDGPAHSEVRYSSDQSYASTAIATDTVYDGKYWHSATIPNLTPGTTYYYKVYSAGEDLTPWPQLSFSTAPEVTATQFTFAVLGDSRPLNDNLPPSEGARAVAAQMGQHRFDFALHTGDIVYSGGDCFGSDSSWNQYIIAFFDLYREIIGHVPLFPSVGNHELNGGMCGYRGYTDVFHLPANAPAGDEEEYYSFNWGSAHFVALDSNQSIRPGSAQYAWLVSDLQSSTQPWKFVFFHHPLYSSGSHGGSLSLRRNLLPVFETYGVDAVFTGHDHHYERSCPILDDACTTSQKGGVVYYVAGGAGAPLYRTDGGWFTAYSDSVYHFLLVDVSGCRLEINALDMDGNVFDRYEINHCSGGADYE